MRLWKVWVLGKVLRRLRRNAGKRQTAVSQQKARSDLSYRHAKLLAAKAANGRKAGM